VCTCQFQHHEQGSILPKAPETTNDIRMLDTLQQVDFVHDVSTLACRAWCQNFEELFDFSAFFLFTYFGCCSRLEYDDHACFIVLCFVDIACVVPRNLTEDLEVLVLKVLLQEFHRIHDDALASDFSCARLSELGQSHEPRRLVL
jgi:hypothetical protein